MAAKLRAILRLYRLYARMDLHWLLQDPVTALLTICSELISNLASVAGVLLLAVRFGGAGGLSADEVLFMLGFYELADSLSWTFFGGFNVMHISRRVGRGQVDHMLIQPQPLVVQLLTEGFLPFSGSSAFFVGVTLTAIACQRLGLRFTFGWALLLIAYLLMHTLLLAGQSYLYGALAFYWPVACEEISSMILDLNDRLGKFPLFGIPRALLGLLCTALPTALLAYVPTLGLLRGLGDGTRLALPAAVALGFALAAGFAFRRGLGHYLTHSCNRYKDMGHRC